jgi:hypothetical protein
MKPEHYVVPNCQDDSPPNQLARGTNPHSAAESSCILNSTGRRGCMRALPASIPASLAPPTALLTSCITRVPLDKHRCPWKLRSPALPAPLASLVAWPPATPLACCTPPRSLNTAVLASSQEQHTLLTTLLALLQPRWPAGQDKDHEEVGDCSSEHVGVNTV